MKKFLETTIKVKHLLIIFVLLFAAKVFLVVNRPHFPRHKQMMKFEHRQTQKGQQMRNHFNGRRDVGKFHDLSDIEKASVDSLRSLIKRGDWENNKVIFKQIREIVKGD